MAPIEPSLTFVSLLAGNADPIYQRLVDALAAASGLRIRLVAAPSWAERTRMLRDGEAALAAVCGATYAEWNAGAGPNLRLLAAPVMAGARYAGQPFYFSDLIVRHDSPRRSFADLRDAALAYNEASSFSGSLILGALLAGLGDDAGYFGRLDASGSHQESLRRVLRGDSDAAAIDSIVLERELRLRPGLGQLLARAGALGPNPAPPLVAARQLPAALVGRLREALLALRDHPAGRAALEAGAIDRFAAVEDHDYDPIRRQISLAARIGWPGRPVREPAPQGATR